MTWLLPSALAIGAIAALAAIALHFIARSRPLAEPLPTARFVPQRPIHARTRSMELSDVPLLLVRIAAVLILAAAIAGPVLASSRGRTARVILADRSRDVGNIQEVRDSVRALFRSGDVVVAFDSDGAAIPTLDSLTRTDARGSLSVALASAVRAGVALAPRIDSVELIVVSPLASDESDAATSRIRSVWPGRARLVQIGAAQFPAAAPLRVSTTATGDDPVIAGLSLMGGLDPASSVRLVRTRLTAGDSAWAHDSGHVLIHWPSADENTLWTKRGSIDAIGGVASTGGAMIARFPRLWVLSGHAVARWADGEPAAVEHAAGAGCIRDVAVIFDPSSDATLRSSFREFVRPLLAPCGGFRVAAPLGAAATRDLTRDLTRAGPLAVSDALRDHTSETSRWTPWLLLVVAALLTLELALRRSEKMVA